MKYFYKLFLSMVFLLSLALCIAGYTAVSTSLQNAYTREYQQAMRDHRLVWNTVLSAVLNGKTFQQTWEEASVGLADSESLSLQVGAQTESNLYRSPEPAELSEGQAKYRVISDGDLKLLEIQGLFSVGKQIRLVTQRNISGVFFQIGELRSLFIRIFFVVLGICALMSAGLAYLLTKPISSLQKTSRELAAGNYHARSTLKRRDELGALSGDFDRMAQALESKIRQLEAASERQERFIADFAHEMKTPMTSIIGYADLLYRSDLSPVLRQAAGQIVQEGIRLEALSQKLMELFVLEKYDFVLEETSAPQLLEDAAATIRPSAEKRAVGFVVHAEDGWVCVEQDLFKTLLTNLLDNALKSGGTQVQLEGISKGDNYVITVCDNGRGMKEQELTKIIEPFYMIDKSRSRKEHGAGLGLSLCARIAALHGTRMVFASKPAQGTRVSINLKKAGSEDA